MFRLATVHSLRSAFLLLGYTNKIIIWFSSVLYLLPDSTVQGQSTKKAQVKKEREEAGKTNTHKYDTKSENDNNDNNNDIGNKSIQQHVYKIQLY
jgi:hypothetical protein